MILLNSKLPTVGTTIFSVMSKLAQQHNAINLSQGFPDFATNPKLINFVADAMKDGHNQYAPMQGLQVLRELVAEKMATIYGANYHPETEITITAGGTQAIFTALAAVINPGDEVIIFEPAYDCYSPTVKLLGGLVKPFELHAPDYAIDWEMVKKLFTANTRMIILNSPHNPTGSILSKADIDALIKLTKNTDILLLSDEVYEHIIFDGEKHQSVALYPELQERSFIVASFGKLLHTTGWKLGYCLAPAKLMAEFRKIHQFNVFSVNTPMQVGIANYLKSENIYETIPAFFQQKRDLFRSLLSETKFKLLPCKGSYFQCVSYSGISDEKDVDMAKRLVTDFGVAGIPVSAFYTKATDDKILRFCFAKEQDTLEKAVERLLNI
ncbi:aminotransferase class I/II-fold pyridoxal phosphate-dependent enzyme [Pedobacter sp. LMG 31464]|uniref:Aminotransferase class I/II-fold pyridoxal phosphate-dependent enzyme n=1 Tax=Pedobacter planticolens TaxID=2679964 RepID=A0A923DVY8_9SPHI|nr:methionine aminotransferase [Pedobacter planticolens]MBB2144947.1 aminotransferase class I/II-fold pyridoxal phosphate-dependent enzyme [Pedobacter planticolens]